MKKPNKVAVIGAGIAGLSCATALQQAGFKVTVFEKSRGASGRLSTRVTEAWQCDHGAQYFTARDALFHAEVQRWIQADVAQVWQPSLQVFDGDTFASKVNSGESETLRYVGYPRNNAPAKWLAAKLDIAFETTVTHMLRHAQQWQIASKERGVHPDRFDIVILAIPAPQAALLLSNTTTELASLCASVSMQPCFALMVQFKQSIACEFDGLFINSGLLSWAARDSAKPGRLKDTNTCSETWVLHANRQWSAAHVDEEKVRVAQNMLTEFFGIIACAAHVKNTTAYTINAESYELHRWLYADCAHDLFSVYQFDAAHNIGLCGDWLNGGKVQGAWLSGLALANSLIHTTQLITPFE